MARVANENAQTRVAGQRDERHPLFFTLRLTPLHLRDPLIRGRKDESEVIDFAAVSAQGVGRRLQDA
jgi:hypothetical protein